MAVVAEDRRNPIQATTAIPVSPMHGLAISAKREMDVAGIESCPTANQITKERRSE